MEGETGKTTSKHVEVNGEEHDNDEIDTVESETSDTDTIEIPYGDTEYLNKGGRKTGVNEAKNRDPSKLKMEDVKEVENGKSRSDETNTELSNLIIDGKLITAVKDMENDETEDDKLNINEMRALVLEGMLKAYPPKRDADEAQNGTSAREKGYYKQMSKPKLGYSIVSSVAEIESTTPDYDLNYSESYSDDIDSKDIFSEIENFEVVFDEASKQKMQDMYIMVREAESETTERVEKTASETNKDDGINKINKEDIVYTDVETLAKSLINDTIEAASDHIRNNTEFEVVDSGRFKEDVYKNIGWPSNKEFTTELGITKIEELIATWCFSDDWYHCIDLRSRTKDACSIYYLYEVRWSKPTDEYPIPAAVASVLFTIEVSRVKPETLPVSVKYVYEGSRYAHIPGKIDFKEEWLDDIIENKTSFFKSLTF